MTNHKNKFVYITKKNVYGNELIYPANQNATAFTRLTGKKTLSKVDLNNIEALGFSVHEV